MHCTLDYTFDHTNYRGVVARTISFNSCKYLYIILISTLSFQPRQQLGAGARNNEEYR